MTMTAGEEKVLQRWADSPHAMGTIYEAVAVLASVALKEEAIRKATATLTKGSSDGR